MWYQNICSASFSFVTVHASARQTDGQTELWEQYRALHYMPHGKKAFFVATTRHVELSQVTAPQKSWSNWGYIEVSLCFALQFTTWNFRSLCLYRGSKLTPVKYEIEERLLLGRDWICDCLTHFVSRTAVHVVVIVVNQHFMQMAVGRSFSDRRSLQFFRCLHTPPTPSTTCWLMTTSHIIISNSSEAVQKSHMATLRP